MLHQVQQRHIHKKTVADNILLRCCYLHALLLHPVIQWRYDQLMF